MKKTFTLIMMIYIISISFAQEGQILYFDFEPDSTVLFSGEYNPNRMFLDLDQDGINEWWFQDGFADWGQYRTLRLIYNWPLLGQENHDFQTSYVSVDLELGPLGFPELGDTLSNFYYEIASVNAQYEWSYYHNHPVMTDHYFEPHFIGIRKQVGENEYCYGWIELSVYFHTWLEGEYTHYQSTNLTVYRAAFCTIPNYSLRAGQTSLNWSVDQNVHKSFASFNPNPTKGMITVTGEDLQQAEVYNIMGQFMLSEQSQGQSITLNLSGQPAGIYLVKITDKKGNNCVKKIVKE